MFTVRMKNSMVFLSLLVLVFAPCLASGAQVGLRLQEAMDGAVTDSGIPIILRMTEQVDSAAYKHLPKKERRNQLVRELRAKSRNSQKELRKLLKRVGVPQVKDLWHINALAFDANPDLIKVLANRAEVASVSLDHLVALPSAQLSAVATPEWNLSAIGVFDLWLQLSATPGDGVVVATIDSGVDATHPNLANWRGGPFDWFDPTDPTNTADTPVDGVDGHGTAVMGVLAGSDIGGEAIGVAPGVTWIAANPFTAGTASFADLHSSFAWALDPNGSQDSADIAPDVVNNSWALNAPGLCVNEFQVDINLLKEAGIGVVFAAGNSGPALFTSQSPANNSNVVAVGATDPSAKIAWFSSRGSSPCDGGSVFPELVAPGVDVRTALPGGYASVDGTSFSAPHIAGVMALLMQAYPAATVTDIETAMIASAVDLGVAGSDSTYGYGQVQGMYAWRYLAGDPILSIHDTSGPANDHHLDFGYVTPETSQILELTLRNAGSSALAISTIDFSGLTAEIGLESDLCSDALLSPGAVCRVSILFSPLDFSSYTGSLTIPSNDPFNGSIVVTLSGNGNTAPPAASLLAPNNGAVNVARPVSFSWTQTADADGDAITTALLISTSPDFSQSTPIPVVAETADGGAVLFASCGLLVVALLLRRRQLSILRLLLAAMAVLLTLSCGGGGSGGGVAGEIISYDHAGLNPDTTYYWKVQSTDARGAMTESVVRQFTTSI